jgi:hypothetical protein
MLGPFALWLGLARRRMQVHRILGVAYMFSVALSCAAAFYLAFHTDISWIFGMGLAGIDLDIPLRTLIGAVKKAGLTVWAVS